VASVMACIVGARGIVGSWLRRIAFPSCQSVFPGVTKKVMNSLNWNRAVSS
jgi:hypothetical protein